MITSRLARRSVHVTPLELDVHPPTPPRSSSSIDGGQTGGAVVCAAGDSDAARWASSTTWLWPSSKPGVHRGRAHLAAAGTSRTVAGQHRSFSSGIKARHEDPRRAAVIGAGDQLRRQCRRRLEGARGRAIRWSCGDGSPNDKDWATRWPNAISLREKLSELADFSMTRWDAEAGTVTVHRVVQEILRSRQIQPRDALEIALLLLFGRCQPKARVRADVAGVGNAPTARSVRRS